MRWPLAIFVGFLVVIAVDGTFIWLAFSGDEPIAKSYTTEAR